MGDDPDRDAILARRQRFIALALSGLATATVAGCERAGPRPCLDVAPPRTDPPTRDVGTPESASTGPEVTPLPCLTPLPPARVDVGTPASGSVGPEVTPQPCLEVTAPVEPPATPTPCLRVKPRPRKPIPQPCLSPPPPRDKPK